MIALPAPDVWTNYGTWAVPAEALPWVGHEILGMLAAEKFDADFRGQDLETLGGFRERIQEGAFSLALGKDPDVRALVDHDPSRILGRTRSGTLALLNTQKGLRYEIKPADTTAGRDIVESIRRGDVSGSSFGFRTLADKWSVEVLDEQRTLVRTLIDVELFDVSPVTYPAYPDTEVGVRSLETWKKQNTVVAIDVDLLRRRLRLAELER